MASETADQAGNVERVETYIERMKALANEPRDLSHAGGLRIGVLYQIILHSRQRGDEKVMEAATNQALDLIRDAESRGWTDADWMGVVRHNIAHELLMRSRHALALPLLEASTSSKGGNRGYTSFMHAVAVWQMTGDRVRTLDLMRHARDTADRDFIGDFRFHREFDSVADDPEFLRAISRGSSS